MDCTDIRDCGRSTYYLALALYKIQFEEIWYHEITNIVKELKVFGRIIMLKNMIITVIILFIAVELIEHIIFPIVWSIFKGRKRSTYGVMGMMGKVVEIRRWNKTEGQVSINGELWSAVCEAPLTVGGKAVVQDIEGLTLKLKPYENS
jgi:membrane-bound serine protease (ClpP class)